MRTIRADFGPEVSKLKMFIIIGEDVMTISNKAMYEFALSQVGCDIYLRPEVIIY